MTIDNTIDLTKCYDIAQALLDRYKQRLVDIDARGTGNFINTLDYDVILNMDAVTITFTVLRYWEQLEYGRPASYGSGWEDPIRDLSKWIQSKIERGKWMPKSGKPLPTTQKQLYRAASGLYLKITEHGYDRKGEKAEPLRRTLEASEDLLEQFANEVAEQIGEQVQAAWLDLNQIYKDGSSKTKRFGNQQIKGK